MHKKLEKLFSSLEVVKFDNENFMYEIEKGQVRG